MCSVSHLTSASVLTTPLINWPRIKTIARVPGDEIDEQWKTLLPKYDVGDTLVTLSRIIYRKSEGDGKLLNPVLFQDKLARTSNSRGCEKFRNLAKISRPKKKRKKLEVDSDNSDKREKRGVGRNEMGLLEVVTEEEDSGGDDLSSLLGEEFKGKNGTPEQVATFGRERMSLAKNGRTFHLVGTHMVGKVSLHWSDLHKFGEVHGHDFIQMYSREYSKETTQINKEPCLGFMFMGSLKLGIQNSTFTSKLELHCQRLLLRYRCAWFGL
ncbi:unnamed protein product [Fraxinus pennsylvanica]|uniref:Uncharacterized protein n=1 Tax=Fraxinus pennsylvanica TaxID=56036 RepID=A0AAD1Z4W7_9LAMI|nr:unnamed protein product [Fraxinus pennsylvanica]